MVNFDKETVAGETRDEIDGLNNHRASDNEPIQKSKAQKKEYLSRLDCGEIRKVAWVFSGFFVLTSTLTEEIGRWKTSIFIAIS